jgi:hypothetical protein
MTWVSLSRATAGWASGVMTMLLAMRLIESGLVIQATLDAFLAILFFYLAAKK